MEHTHGDDVVLAHFGSKVRAHMEYQFKSDIQSSDIESIIRDIYPACGGAPYIDDVDVSSYYMANGAKITKKLQGIMNAWAADSIVGCEGKKYIASKWADFCNRVSALYLDENAIAYIISSYFDRRANSNFFGDEYSCFFPRGCNEGHGQMLDASAPCFVLGVRVPARGSMGRMILQVTGRQTAILYNRYAKEGVWEIPVALYVRAIETYTGAGATFKKMGAGDDEGDHSQGSAADGLPKGLYVNGAAANNADDKGGDKYWKVRLTGEGNFDNLSTIYRLTCPICGDDMTAENCQSGQNKDGRGIICCGCEYEQENEYYCESCGEGLNENEAYSTGGSPIYCERCFNDRYTMCDDCNEYTRDTTTVNNYRGRLIEVCEDCLENYCRCDNCDDYCHIDNLHEVDGKLYCDDCLSDNFSKCSGCGEYRKNEELMGGEICEDCIETFINDKEGAEEKMAGATI